MATSVRSATTGSAAWRGCRADRSNAAVAANPAGASSGATAPLSMRSAVSGSRSLARLINQVMAWTVLGVTHQRGEFSGQTPERSVLQGTYRTRTLPHDGGDLLNRQIRHHPQEHHLSLRGAEPGDGGQRFGGAQPVEGLGFGVAAGKPGRQLMKRRRLG